MTNPAENGSPLTVTAIPYLVAASLATGNETS